MYEFNELLVLGSLGVSMLCMIAVIIILAVILFKDRAKSQRVQSELLNRIMAVDLTEYAQTKQALETTPAENLKQLKVENDLAINAAKIEEAREQSTSYPVM